MKSGNIWETDDYEVIIVNQYWPEAEMELDVYAVRNKITGVIEGECRVEGAAIRSLHLIQDYRNRVLADPKGELEPTAVEALVQELKKDMPEDPTMN